MTHKTIMGYYPRHRSLMGRFIEIEDFCGPVEEVDELEEKQYFQRLMGSNEIPLVYYGTDKNFHHVIFCYKPVVAYIAFDDYDDFYPAVPTDDEQGIELFNPWEEDPLGWEEKDEIIVAKTRAFEDFVEAAKEHLIEHYCFDNEQVFTNWIEMKNFMEGKKSE